GTVLCSRAENISNFVEAKSIFGSNYKRNAYTKADLQCMNAYTKEVESCFPSDANINNVAKFLTGTVWSIKKQCKVLMISYVDDSGGLEATLGIKFIMRMQNASLFEAKFHSRKLPFLTLDSTTILKPSRIIILDSLKPSRELVSVVVQSTMYYKELQLSLIRNILKHYAYLYSRTMPYVLDNLSDSVQ
uniref:Uncharacterized protein n=1 Tax=Cucumis melo TaxID=3656 RepID=A0A9I9EM12_CUCME